MAPAARRGAAAFAASLGLSLLLAAAPGAMAGAWNCAAHPNAAAYCKAMWVMANAENAWDNTCATFLQCANGQPVVKNCPPGTLFDRNIMVCNHANLVDCKPSCGGAAPPNPCATSNGGCSADATCTNANGQAVCACKDGFSGDGRTCTRIIVNPCATNNGGCASDATCAFTNGQAVCACKAGFTGNGWYCSAIPTNPCAANNGGCSGNATCTSVGGQPSCACKAGFTGNGWSCNPATATCATKGCYAPSECQRTTCQASGVCSAVTNAPDGTACSEGTCKAGVCTCLTGWNGWFAPYKDITINFNWGSNVIGALDAAGNRVPLPNAMPASLSIITLAFAAGECGAETWAGVSVAAVQNTIQALIRANKRYIISTGGAAGKFMCGSAVGMATFMSRYYTPYMVGLDFDIEVGQTQAEITALVQRAYELRLTYPTLKIGWTIPTWGSFSPVGGDNLPAGKVGIWTVSAVKAIWTIGGVLSIPATWYINLMVMYFGTPSATVCVLNAAGGCDMGTSAIAAVETLVTVHKISYINIGLTAMIGRNDHPLNVFTLNDMSVVVNYVISNNLPFFSFWSFDRDRDCAAGPATPTCNNMGANVGYQAFINGASGFSQQACVVGPDPCQVGGGGCSPFASCTVVKGTRRTAVCRCNTGYIGNGTFCTPGCAINGCPSTDECKTGGLCSANGLCGPPSNKPDGTACSIGTCKFGVCTPKSGWNGWFTPIKDITIDWSAIFGFAININGTISSLEDALPIDVPIYTISGVSGDCSAEKWNAPTGAAAGTVITPKMVGGRCGKCHKGGKKKYTISFGTSKAKFTCGSQADFAAMIDRYWTPSLQGLDFYITVDMSEAEIIALVARAFEIRTVYPSLRISFSIPTLGINAAGVYAKFPVSVFTINAIKAKFTVAGILSIPTNWYINVRAMDYGAPNATVCTLNKNGGCDMGQSAINAMTGLFLYYKIPAINIGVTISIGRNDVASSVVTAADLAVISKHMNTYKGAAVHIANLDRDRNCRAGEAPATCSGASLGPFGFTNAFASGLLNDGLNPCALSNGGCAPDATCTYSAVYGLTVCACKAGFVGNGYACDKIRACNPLSLTSCPATDCLYQSLCPVTSTCSLALPINEGKACNSGAGTCRSGACAPNAA